MSVDRDCERGTGRTTQQIREAPKGAVFVVEFWGEVTYARRLAESLGRSDLKIFSVKSLGTEGGLLHGVTRAVVFDHAARPNPAQCEAATAATLAWMSTQKEGE